MGDKICKPILSRTPTYSPHIPLKSVGGRSLSLRGRWGVFTDGSRWNTSPAPLNRLFHSLLAFSALNKLKTCQIFAPFFHTLHAVPVSFMVPKFSLKFATQSNKFEIMANYTSTANVVLSVNGKQAQQMLSTLQREDPFRRYGLP